MVLKFYVRQSKLIRKKSVFEVCEIININVDFRIFVNASHTVFLKKH